MSEYRINVYKIWWADEPEKFYVGSTKKRLLSERMIQHRSNSRRGRMSKIYVVMREKGINTFQYVLLGWSLVSNFNEQRMLEQSYIARLNPTLNSSRAYTTEDERKADLRARCKTPEVRAYKKSYHQRPDVKEANKVYRKAYLQIPEVKESVKVYMKAYSQIPEIKDHLKTYQKLYRKTYNIQHKQQQKEMYEEKKDRRTCICGVSYDYGNKKRSHYQSQRHQAHVALIFAKLRGEN